MENHHVKTSQFPQILLLVELILSVEWASSSVERGFSTVNRMLTNTRLSLSKGRLNNLLMLRINVPILTSLDAEYESKLIDKAVSQYLSTKRYETKKKSGAKVKQHQYGTSSEDLFLPPTKRKQPCSALLRNEDYLNISSDENEELFLSDDDFSSGSQDTEDELLD